jgi:hypothetical protein
MDLNAPMIGTCAGDTSVWRVPCAGQLGSQTQDGWAGGVGYSRGGDGCERHAQGPVPDLVPFLVPFLVQYQFGYVVGAKQRRSNCPSRRGQRP